MRVNLPQNSASESQREVLDALPALVFLEQAGRIVFANAEARRLLGLEDGESLHRPTEDVLWGLFPSTAEPQVEHPPDPSELKRGRAFHATILARNGRMLPVEGTYCSLDSGRREGIVVAHAGGRERAPRSRLMEDVLASIPEAVVIVHQDRLLYTNPAYTKMFGFTSDEVAGGTLRDFIVPETRLHEISLISQGVEQYGRFSMETVRKTKSGDLIDVAMLTGPLAVNGVRVGYAISYRDISGRKQVEARLQHDAMHDVLTGLPNRALFLDRLSLAFSRVALRRELACGVLFIDLDKFKGLNDSLGRATGDLLLTAVAERLRTLVRPQHTAARLAGDEFAILVESLLDVADLEIVARRISQELEKPYAINGHSIRVGASIGVAIAGPEHADPESLLRDAEYAMHRAKQEGGARFEMFDERLEVHPTVRQEHERKLRQVLENHRFEIGYEPVYWLGAGRLQGFESTLRFSQADIAGHFVELLELAEESGLSIALGWEMVATVCKQFRQWPPAARDLTLGVNLSRRQFYHPDLPAQLTSILSAASANPASLMFEVSESTLNENPEASIAILRRLAAIGVRIALDDFGSSLAPVNHLVRLPIDVVKMHPGMSAAIEAGGRQAALLESLINLCRPLGIQTIAQGIETAGQLAALRQLGFEMGQGPLFSPQVSADAARNLIALTHWQFTPLARATSGAESSAVIA